ncbi:TPA: bacteriocin [bacterium]|nr:bacteriocin [bacterium]
MSEYLGRNDSPLSSDNWSAIDQVVTESAKKRLIGRKFIDITGPLGVGTQMIQSPKLGGFDNTVEITERVSMSMLMISKDFKLSWRDIESSKQNNTPIELGPAAVASAFCANKEDDIIFNGDKESGYAGLTNVKGAVSINAVDWKDVGNGFQNVVNAIEKLASAGLYGPYAMAVSTPLYAMLHRSYGAGRVLEIDMIRELVSEGIFQTPLLKNDKAVLIATGRENLDLVIAQDFVTAYLGPDNMDHLFRVFESIVLRIKRPESICVFSSK